MSDFLDQYTYVELEEALALYDEIKGLPLGGARSHLRDEGLLESALLRPQQAAYYEGADLAQQAATLLYGIAENQPFIDGNKRLAIVTTITFIELNDAHLDCSDDELFAVLHGVAVSATVGQVAEFLRDRLRAGSST